MTSTRSIITRDRHAQIPEAPIKDQFRRYARVNAAKNSRKRLLTLSEFNAPAFRLVHVGGFLRDIPLIAREHALQGFLRIGDGRFRR